MRTTYMLDQIHHSMAVLVFSRCNTDSPSWFPEYNISAASIAIFSLAFTLLGTLCLLGAFGKGRDYLLRPSGMFYAFAGEIQGTASDGLPNSSGGP